MIAVGFLCVLVAVGLLVAGLVAPNQSLVGVSIGASVLGGLVVAIAAVARSRQPRPPPAPGSGPAGQGRHQATAATGGPEAGGASGPAQRGRVGDDAVPVEGGASAEQPADRPAPVGEPGEEDPDMSVLLTIIDLDDEVLVVDARPRYHLAGCSYLHSRTSVPLPIRAAREAGFTPCRWCRPDASLAAAVRAGR